MTAREAITEGGRKQTAAGGVKRKLRPFAGYIRVSRVGERDERLRSPDFQRAGGDAKAKAEGAEVIWEEPELDVSGSDASRPVLDRIVAMIEAGERAGVIVYNLSRLSRLPPRERIELVERIEHAGGRIISACESFDTSTPEGRFQRELFFSLARMQWEKAAEDFAAAKEYAVENGTKISAIAPFGYKFDEEHKLVIVPGEAALVRRLFEMRAAGRSRGELLELFERETGRTSYRQSMAYILRNRVYLGEVSYGKKRPLLKVDAHEAIVDHALFEAVQRVDREKSSGPGSGGRPKALLAGIARCDNCKRGLVRDRRGGSGSRRHYYKCPQDARSCTSRANIGAAELDAYVERQILAWAGRAADETIEVMVDRTPRAALQERLAEARKLRQAFAVSLEAQLLGEEAYEEGMRVRRELEERLEAELEAAGEESEIEIARTTLRQAITSELGVAERRRLLAVVLEAVYVRRTPYRGAPASERAALVFRKPVGENAAELVKQAAA